MCEQAIDLSEAAKVVVIGAMAVIAVVLWLWFEMNADVHGYGCTIIPVALGVAVVALVVGVTAEKRADSSCPHPDVGVYPIQFTLGYEGQTGAPMLERAEVTESSVTFHVQLAPGVTTFDCPRADEINGLPAVRFSRYTSDAPSTIYPSSYSCQGFDGQVITVPEGTMSTTFPIDWRYRTGFTFWWYGANVEDLELDH